MGWYDNFFIYSLSSVEVVGNLMLLSVLTLLTCRQHSRGHWHLNTGCNVVGLQGVYSLISVKFIWTTFVTHKILQTLWTLKILYLLSTVWSTFTQCYCLLGFVIFNQCHGLVMNNSRKYSLDLHSVNTFQKKRLWALKWDHLIKDQTIFKGRKRSLNIKCFCRFSNQCRRPTRGALTCSICDWKEHVLFAFLAGWQKQMKEQMCF